MSETGGGSDPRSGSEPPAPPDGSADAEPSSPSRARIAELRARADVLQRQAHQRFEQERAQRGWVQKVVEAWDMDRHRAGPLLAGGLAYRIFLFEVPAALFLVSLFGVYAELADRGPDELATDSGLSGAVAAVVSQAVAASGSARWWLLILGAWLMVWAARAAVRAVRLIAAIAWRLPLSTVRASLKSALVFTAFVLGAFASQSYLPGLLGGGVVRNVLVAIALTSVAFVFATLGFALLPHGGSGWLPVVPGALLLAVGLRVLSLATDLYFAGHLDHVDDLYGGLGIAIVILLVLYLASRLFVWGHFLNARFGGVTMTTPLPDSDAPIATGD